MERTITMMMQHSYTSNKDDTCVQRAYKANGLDFTFLSESSPFGRAHQPLQRLLLR